MTLLDIHETIQKAKKTHNLPAQCLEIELSHDILKELQRVFTIKDTHLGMKIILKEGKNVLHISPREDSIELLDKYINAYPNSAYAGR